MKKFLKNTYKCLIIFNKEFSPMESIFIGEDSVTLSHKDIDYEIIIEITDIDIMLHKTISKRYMSSTRFLFSPINFLTKEDISGIKNFLFDFS